jgi:hypothetical protein
MDVTDSPADPAWPGFVPGQVPKVNYKKGEEVEVFYKIAEDTAGFFPVSLGSLTPRIGMTDGWMSAFVEDEFDYEVFERESLRKQKLQEEQRASKHRHFNDDGSNSVRYFLPLCIYSLPFCQPLKNMCNGIVSA